jgi:DNA-binding helix-hairpin-helix protein with protein kinase domain
MIDVTNNTVGFIDTDSYQLTLNGRIFRCAVGTPEYTPPELQGYDFKTIDRSSHADFFSAAVIVFQILMRSRHPFDIVNGQSPAENIKKGNFPYGTNQGKLIPKGNWIKLWSHLPKRIKDMFHRAFIDGVHKPAARPSMDEWVEALEIYWKDSQKGWHDLSLMPTDFKSQDYHGKRAI